MTALAEAHGKGMINDKQRDEAIRLGREFRRAYLNAVDLLIAGTQDDTAIALVQASLKVLMDYVTPLIVQGGTKK